MKLPAFVRAEIEAVLGRANGRRSVNYRSNFSSAAWQHVLQLTDEDFFKIRPPKTLASKGKKVGKFESRCERCGKPTRFISYTVGYTQYCATGCGVQAFAQRETTEERKARMEKMQNTMVEKYGAHCSVLAGLQDVSQLHSAAAYVNSAKTRERKYGTHNKRTPEQAARLKAITDRCVAGLRKTRMNNPNIFTGQKYQRKTIRIRGRIFSVQGYEPQVLKYLVQSGRTDVDTIEVQPFGIEYVEHGKTRLYIPDFRAKISGKWYVVEVKSNYTAGLVKNAKTMFYNLRRKSKAVCDAGHRFLTIVYDHKRDEFIEIQNIHNYSISEARKLLDPDFLTVR